MSVNKIKLYTELSIIPDGLTHTFLLIPFLGDYPVGSDDPDVGRFEELKQNGSLFYALSDEPKEAHFFLLPFGYSFQEEHQTIIKAFLKKAEQHAKKTLLFYNSDDDQSINHHNVLVYRTSLNKSSKKPYEYALPGWSLDFRFHYKEQRVVALEPGGLPGVSYCGYINTETKSLKSYVKKILGLARDTNETKAKELRGKVCRVLQSNKRIKTDFIIRLGFWAQGINNKQQARLEYVNNLMHSVYAIAARGGGNFSYRFYEILSCGRIPLFINTDSVLPFEQEIDYKKHLMWVEEKEIKRCDKLLLEFHQHHTAEELKALQLANRELYETHLSPLGFFKSLHRHLMKLV